MDTNYIIQYFFILRPVDWGFLREIQLHVPDYANLDYLNRDELPATWKRDVAYYGTPYVGGIYLSRYILDHPEEVAGKRVLDICSGSAIVAISSAKAGAAESTASDHDEIAVELMQRNAKANKVQVRTVQVDAFSGASELFENADVITVADAFAEAPGLEAVLLGQFRKGKTILACSGRVPINSLMEQGTPLSPSDNVDITGRKLKPDFMVKLSGPSFK